MNKVSAKCDIVQSISLGGEWDYYVVLSSFLSRACQAVSEADGADTSKLIFDNEHILPDSEFQTKLPPNNHNHNVNTEKAQQSSSECRSLAQLSRGPPTTTAHTHTHTPTDSTDKPSATRSRPSSSLLHAATQHTSPLPRTSSTSPSPSSPAT